MEQSIKSTVTDGSGIETKTTSNRIEHEDGSYEETRVEEVDGGFIKTISKRFKNAEGDWQYSDDRSVSVDNPLEDNKSLVEKLKDFVNH